MNPPLDADSARGWQRQPEAPSLREVHGSIAVPIDAGFWRKLFAFAGPGYLVAVGYMDPGNWATDLAGGARYGYTLLSVILLSNLMAILLQALAVRLGHRQRARPGTGMPRQLLAAGDHRAVDPVRNRDRGLRPRRSDRRRHRAQPALRPAADVGRVPHRARRDGDPVPAEQGVSLGRGAGRGADRRHRRVLRDRDLALETGRRRRGRRVRADDGGPDQPGDAVHRPRHPGRDRHAAQPVSALLDRADQALRGYLRQQGRGDPLRDAGLVDRADVGAVHQRRHPDRLRGGVRRHASTRRWPTSAMPTSC